MLVRRHSYLCTAAWRAGHSVLQQQARGEEDQPVLVVWARRRVFAWPWAPAMRCGETGLSRCGFLLLLLPSKWRSVRGVLAEEEDFLQRSAFLKVKGGSTALRTLNEREDGDCPPHGFGD